MAADYTFSPLNIKNLCLRRMWEKTSHKHICCQQQHQRTLHTAALFILLLNQRGTAISPNKNHVDSELHRQTVSKNSFRNPRKSVGKFSMNIHQLFHVAGFLLLLLSIFRMLILKSNK